MNELEELKKRYTDIVNKNDIHFDAHIFYHVYDFWNMHTLYKNKKIEHVKTIFLFITGLEDHEIEFLKSNAHILMYESKLIGKKKVLWEDICSYIQSATIIDQLNDYYSIERKRKIKEVLNDE